MKIFKNIICVFLLLLCISCDTEGDYLETSYINLQVKLEFQADKSVIYHATIDDVPVPSLDSYGSTIRLTKNTNAVVLKVYEEEIDVPVLEENVEIHNGSVISLVQLPNIPIAIASSGIEEEDPTTRNRIKIRFFYAQEDLGNSLKIDVFGTDGGGDLSTWDEITSFTIEKGIFSDYIELDMAKYYTPETVAAGEYHDPMYCLDVTDLNSGEKIMEYTTFGLRLDLVWDKYETPDENGARSGYKFMSSEMIIDRTYGYGYFNFCFGTPWE